MIDSFTWTLLQQPTTYSLSIRQNFNNNLFLGGGAVCSVSTLRRFFRGREKVTQAYVKNKFLERYKF